MPSASLSDFPVEVLIQVYKSLDNVTGITALKVEAWQALTKRSEKVAINNASASGPTPNEVAYGFTPNKPLDLISMSSAPNQFLARTTASDAIAFAQMLNQFHYDQKHWNIVSQHQETQSPLINQENNRVGYDVNETKNASNS